MKGNPGLAAEVVQHRSGYKSLAWT